MIKSPKINVTETEWLSKRIMTVSTKFHLHSNSVVVTRVFIHHINHICKFNIIFVIGIIIFITFSSVSICLITSHSISISSCGTMFPLFQTYSMSSGSTVLHPLSSTSGRSGKFSCEWIHTYT